jgi:hypothetical protein
MRYEIELFIFPSPLPLSFPPSSFSFSLTLQLQPQLQLRLALDRSWLLGCSSFLFPVRISHAHNSRTSSGLGRGRW